jgi:hypothetical protein
MRYGWIEIYEDDAGVVSVQEKSPEQDDQRFNNAEVIGLLTQFIHSKITQMNGGK